jgi:hypothetical protein
LIVDTVVPMTFAINIGYSQLRQPCEGFIKCNKVESLKPSQG